MTGKSADVGAGEYRPLLQLGAGGMARVDLAVRAVGTFRRLYAVKRLHPHLVADPGARAVLEEEARIAGSLSHPNVVGVIDVGEDDDGPFLVMDYVEGLTLAELQTLAVRHGEAVPIEVACAIALAIARALDCIHTATDPSGAPLALVHRDLSPRNILLGYDGGVRLTDFGIAHADGRTIQTTTGLLKGTPGYVAPERLRFEDPDARADLFSLGVVLYELLAGERLYKGKAQAVVRRVLQEPPPDLGELRPEAPPELVELLFDLLAKRPEDRPAKAADVVVALEGIVGGLSLEGDGVAVGAYTSFLGAERRTLRQAEVERALDAASTELAGTTLRLGAIAPEPEKKRWPVALGVGIVVAFAGGIGVMALTDDRTPTEPMAAPAQTAPPEVAEPEPEPEREETSEPDERDEPVVEAPAEPSVEPPGQPAVAEESESEPRRTRRRRRRRGRMRAMAAATKMTAGAFPREMDWDGDLR